MQAPYDNGNSDFLGNSAQADKIEISHKNITIAECIEKLSCLNRRCSTGQAPFSNN